MKSGHGSLSRKRTRPGSTIWTSRTRSLSSFAPAPRYRSNENFTSSAVTGSPLWNLTPLRMTNSYVSPSLDCVNDSARLGVFGPAGIGFTSASWSAYSTMNGVMIPSVSAGSSQREASVMWTPHVIEPSGAAAAGATLARRKRSARRYLMVRPPSRPLTIAGVENFSFLAIISSPLRARTAFGVRRDGSGEVDFRRAPGGCDGQSGVLLGVGGGRAHVHRPAHWHLRAAHRPGPRIHRHRPEGRLRSGAEEGRTNHRATADDPASCRRPLRFHRDLA